MMGDKVRGMNWFNLAATSLIKEGRFVIP